MNRTIKKIIIHCSATREGQDISVDTIRDWHLKRGWADIGYHYVIDLNGVVHAGRPIEKTGAHTKGHNTGSIGICYIGGVEQDGRTPKDTRTEKQKDALDNLVFILTDIFFGATVHGHNEFASKACPSFNVQTEYGK